MFERENVVGLLLLGLCVAAGAILVYAIVTDTELEYNGPGWLVPILTLLFLGGLAYGLVGAWRARRGGGPGGGGWPHPQAGRRPAWRRWFRRDDDGP